MKHIEVIIAYEPCKRMGFAINRAMEKVDDWALFLDHDVFICNPNWYEMCLEAIDKVGHKAGWISAVANRNAPYMQSVADGPSSENIIDHINYAKVCWEKHGIKLVEFDKFLFVSFFVLTHKEAWKAVGGLPDWFAIDTWYSNALVAKGYKGYVMPGLYFYHLWLKKKECWMDWANWKGNPAGR